MTTYSRSVNFDTRARNIIEKYMADNHVTSFSLAVREIINKYAGMDEEVKRWRTIAYRTQGMNDEGMKV